MKHSIGLIGLLALLLAACGNSTASDNLPSATSESGSIIIAYSAPELVGGQLTIQQSLERHARDRGWQIITNTSGNDAQKQNEQIGEFLNLGVDAVVVVPEDSEAICTAVMAAETANIPFYTIDRSPVGCPINMTVLANNYLAGQQSAEALVAFLTEKHGTPRGTVLEITGNMAQNVAQLRGSGFQDVLADYPDITLLSEVGDWDKDKGITITRAILAEHTDLDGIYLHSDNVYEAAVLQVLEDNGKLHRRDEPGHIFVAGVDGGEDAMGFIRDGYVDQASRQPLDDFGIITEWIAQELNGQPIVEGEVVREGALWSPAHITMSDIGPQLFLSTISVTAENIDALGHE